MDRDEMDKMLDLSINDPGFRRTVQTQVRRDGVYIATLEADLAAADARRMSAIWRSRFFAALAGIGFGGWITSLLIG